MQGLVNMVDVGPDTTGTLLVKDGSHMGHAPFFQSACTLSHAEMAATTDHYQLKPQELPFFDRFHSLGLRGRAGSLFLWDSRTIHAVSALSQGHCMSNVASLVIVLLDICLLCSIGKICMAWGPSSQDCRPCAEHSARIHGALEACCVRLLPAALLCHRGGSAPEGGSLE